jgi:hypothetical protein
MTNAEHTPGPVYFQGRAYDFTKMSDQQLKRSLEFNERDTGTESLEDELKRCWLIQEMTAEVERRAALAKATGQAA